MKEIVPAVRTRVPGREKKLALGWFTATASWMVAASVLFPMDIGPLVMGLSLSIILGLIGFIFLVVAAAATKGDAISPGTGWAVGIVAFVLLVAGVAMYLIPATTSSGVNPPPPGSTPLAAYVAPSVDTTASLPASPYTACTSLTLQGVSGQTGAGVVWGAANAVYVPDSPTSGHYLEKEAINTALASGASGFITSTCFQMKFTFQYKQVPSIQGVKQAQPYMLKVDSISYVTMTYNNGTLVNLPVFPQQQSGAQAGDWLLLILDKNSVWHPACGEYSNQATLGTGGCGWVTLGTNDGTTADTVTFDVIVNKVGPFGYDTTFSPVGKQLVVTYEIGLPLGQVGSTAGYYLPSFTYQLQVQRNS